MRRIFLNLDNDTELPIHNLSDRHPGVTQAIGESYTEAARACLDRHHESPIYFRILNNTVKQDAVVKWQSCDSRTLSALANETDTTENGAYACALASVELTRNMVAIHRAEIKTGADYYIAPIGSEIDDLENCIRLEISGVDTGHEAIILQRLNIKVKQAASGNSNLPAVAAVIGFKDKSIHIRDVTNELV